MTEFLPKVLDSLGWHRSDIIKKKHGHSAEITAETFIEAMLSTDSIPELAELLKIGEQTANRIITKNLIPLLGKRTGGNNTWKLAILSHASIKKCQECKVLLDYSKFTIDNSKFDHLDSKCKKCKSVENATSYRTNIEYYKKYIDEHLEEYRARNAYRRAKKLQATPSWANIEKIKTIYKNCPKGYHVDHIYPLISEWVCGLHVEQNLQYLSAEENMQKGNRQSPDGEIW